MAKMRNVDFFELSKHPGPYETWPRKTELIKNGMPTGREIPGYVIEAQYEQAGGFLLVTSWDCPFEEAQTFLLLSSDLDVLYEETIGAAYASVWLESHEPVTESSAMFHCDGDLDVLVTVVSGKKLILEKFNRATGEKWPG